MLTRCVKRLEGSPLFSVMGTFDLCLLGGLTLPYLLASSAYIPSLGLSLTQRPAYAPAWTDQ